MKLRFEDPTDLPDVGGAEFDNAPERVGKRSRIGGPSVRAYDLGNCTIVGDLAERVSSPSPPIVLPLTVSFPWEAPILTVEPSRISPANRPCASGSCTHF